MVRFLIFIKHNFAFIWKIIEWGNGVVFSLLFGPVLKRTLPVVIEDESKAPFSYRVLNQSDATNLSAMINAQESSDLEYFSPHRFDLSSIMKQFSNRSILLMGVFDETRIIGYFFLRFFASKKCFVGRLIDKDYRGKGIGLIMNNIMYETGWRMGFRCLSTISRNNTAVMAAHGKNPRMVIIKELQNDYLLVEFLREGVKERET